MTMFPDLGLYLVEQGQQEPFELAVFNHLMLGEDRVLGWLINGVTHQFRTSGLDERPAPIIPEPMMFSIYLGRGSKTRTSSIAERLRTEGLVVVARSDKKYLVPSGQEWVVPLEYLKNFKLDKSPK